MAEIKWTDEQKQIIEHKGCDLIVSASAGCGKTTVMIERILSLLENGVPLEKMIVCTFTKAAAADMRAKLHKQLLNLADEKEYARAALKALPPAQISTLHSFCQHLIKTYFYASGVDPSFEIMEENDAGAALYASAEKVILEKTAEGDADFALLQEAMMKNRSLASLTEELVRLYYFASSQPDFEGWLDKCLDNYPHHAEHLDVIVKSFDADFESLSQKAEQLEEATVRADFKRNIPACQDLCYAVKSRLPLSVIPKGKLPSEAVLLDLNDVLAALKEEYRKLLGELDKCRVSSDPILAKSAAAHFKDMALRLKKQYGDEKNAKAYADYADLEHFALKILKNETVRQSLKGQFSYMFVDEYQDINPIQEEIIGLIIAEKFFVGDIKQSIYAFRMCEPDIFVRKSDRFLKGEGGEAKFLNSNFRSTPSILDFCNRLFSRIMTRPFGGVDYSRSAKFLFSGEGQPSDVRIAFITEQKKEEEEREYGFYSVKQHPETESDEENDAQVNLITDRIFEIIDSDPDASFSDIAVLVRSNSSLVSRLKERLKKQGIPVSVSDKKSASDCTAAAALIEYLKLIDNHFDDVALVAVMRSAFGGFSDSELAQIRLAAKDGMYFNEAAFDAAENLSGALKVKLQKFYGSLLRYTQMSYALKASEVAAAICAENDYFKYVFGSSEGLTKARELAAFLDAMESSVYNSSVPAFVAALKNDMPQVSLAAETDAVKIMTIHSSKGLEFDYVILADACKEFNRKDFSRPLLLDPELGLAAKFWDESDKSAKKTSLYMRIAMKNRRKMTEEEMRILYVALTRAKKSLTITGFKKELPQKPPPPEKAESFFDWFSYALPDIKNYILDASECIAPAARPEKRILYSKPDPVLLKLIKDYTDFKRVENSAPFKVSVTGIVESMPDEEPENSAEGRTVRLFEDADKAAEKGTAYHKFMELFDYRQDFEAEWGRVYPLVDNSGLCSRNEIEKAFNIFKEYIAGREFFRELPFIADIPVEGLYEDGVLVQGIIDLLVKDGGGYEIIDYKTGVLNADKLRHYSKQLSLYERAANRILGSKIKNKYIYSFESGEFVKV